MIIQQSHQWFTVIWAGLLAIGMMGCTSLGNSPNRSITKEPWGKTKDGTPVEIFTLRNANGVEARISNYGGIIVSFKVPDRNGHFEDVVLGYDQIDGYLKASPYFGAMVGRYANRIGGAKFTLDGKEYKLAANNNGNSLHGGNVGFDKKVWEVKMAQVRGTEPSLELHYTSKDGEEGFPGNLSVTALYTLTDDNAIKLEFTATTDKDTIVNLTQHSYFNLAGKGDVLNYDVMIAAGKFLPVDSTLIPTGELRPVEGTPFDFRKPTAIGARINDDNEQLKFGKGYDHCWVINKPPGALGLMARVHDPASGRVLEVFSNTPGLQFYTANHLNGITGKGGWTYKPRNAFCMEPGAFPDSPNKPEFPSPELKPAQRYKHTIIYRCSVEK